MTRAAWVLAVVLCVVGLAARDAGAHARSVSWSAWSLRGVDIEVTARVARMDLDAAGLPSGPGVVAPYVERSLRADSAGGTCAVVAGSASAQAAADDEIVVRWRLRCPEPGGLRITSDLFFDVLPRHTHLATLVEGGQTTSERVLTAEARTWSVGDAAGDARAQASGVGDFVWLGIRHVSSGADHLVFLLALLAGATSLRALAAVVTGFTVGHSATLALAVLGGVRPDSAAVEALIGASIVVVAAENVWLEERDPWIVRALVAAFALAAGASLVHVAIARAVLAGLALFVAGHFVLLGRVSRPANLRWTLAALFGAVHGLAFSGVLSEMHLPRARVASSLFGFNAGVEIAQLALVAVAWPVWRRITRGAAKAVALELASAAAMAAGAFWFVERAFGG